MGFGNRDVPAVATDITSVRRRHRLVLLGLVGLLVFVIFVAILTGYTGPIAPSGGGRLSFKEAIQGIFGHTNDSVFFWDIRIPRVVFAGIVGAALACAGTAMQAIFRNSMADPFIIGVSSGAAVGAVCASVLGFGAFLGSLASPLFAFVSALVTVFVVYSLGVVKGRVYVDTVLLSGVAVAAFLGAVVSFIIYYAGKHYDRLIPWLLGSFVGARWSYVEVAVLPVVAGAIVIYLCGRDLNAILMGEETAYNLGTDPDQLKKVMLGVAALITSAAVAFVGIVGFVGLIVPHMMRLLVGADHRILVPASTLFGATFLIAADAVARTAVVGEELPVGIITALCGGPFFLYLLRRNRMRGES